jgi:uncharacterized membrane protein
MMFSNDVLVRVAILILGICGFVVARHIYKHKNNNENPLVCPINFDCHGVVHSGYSKFFGIPLEILGMIYYALVSFSYLFLIFIPASLPSAVLNLSIIASCLAFIFSLYLIGVQIFVLKKGCSWCIVSAIISALIFTFTVATYHFEYIVHIFV